jgi:hypothetical protein
MVAKKTAKKIAVESSPVATATAPIATLEAPASPLPALLEAPLNGPSTPTIHIDLANQPTSPLDVSRIDPNQVPAQIVADNNHHDDLSPPVTSTSEEIVTSKSDELQLKIAALAKLKKENTEKKSLMNARILSDQNRMLDAELKQAEKERESISQQDSYHSDMMESHVREQEKAKRADSKLRTDAIMAEMLLNCEAQSRSQQSAIDKQVQSDAQLARSLFNTFEKRETKSLEQILEPTYWRADQVKPRVLSISEGVMKELAEGLSDEEEDLLSLSSVHISNPPDPIPMVLIEEVFKTSGCDEETVPTARLEYIPHVTKEIPHPSAPFPENTALIALQAEFTTNEAKILTEFREKETIRRGNNFKDSIRMSELGLDQTFLYRVKQEDAELRSKYEHEKSERSKIQVARDLQAVKQYKNQRTGHDRERYLLEQSNMV